MQIQCITSIEHLNSQSPLVSGKSNSALHRFLAQARAGSRYLARPVLAMTVAALAPLAASAQSTITWGPVTTVSSDSDVITSGSPLYAYSGGIASGTTNVFGVTFAAGSGFAAWGNVAFTSGFTGSSASAFGVASAPFSGLTNTYQTILQGGAYGGATAGTITLNGLTSGQDYAVQIWVNDSRALAASRNETITGTSVNLPYNNYGAIGGVGAYSVGYFTASSTNQAISLTPSAAGSVQLNAICVRAEGAPQRIWLGTTDTSWGTPANWNPGVVPFPGDAVIFNASSSPANLATMLDANHTVGALTLSNAPAAVSIGSDGNTLTINGGVNLLGSGQNLSLADAVVLGNSQTWDVTNNNVLTVNDGISGATNTTGLTIAGGGTVTFGSAATYTGNTTISGGKLTVASGSFIKSANISVATNATFALSGGGSGDAYISVVPTITLAGGATLDVSTLANPFVLAGGTLASSSAGAVINGTNDCTSGTISMTYDGVNPPFIQTNGSMTLSGNSPGTTVKVNVPGAVLSAGSYTLVTAATGPKPGIVTNDAYGLPQVSVIGNGAVGAASLNYDTSGDLVLVIGTPAVWTGAQDNTWMNGMNWFSGNEPMGEGILFNNLSIGHLSNITQNDPGAGEALGLTVINPAGPVTIGGPNGLQIYGGGINLSAASQNLTITAPMTLDANQNWIVTTNRTLGIGGTVLIGSGSDVTVSGGGKLQMTAPDVLDGVTNNTTAGQGDFTINSTLDLNGYSQVMNGLTNGSGGVVDNTGAGAATLTVGFNGDSSTFNGILQNSGGPLTLQVAGGGVAFLQTNTYTGGTIFNGGTLSPSASYSLGTGPVAINPGGGTYTFSCTFTNSLFLNGAYLRLGGNSDNQTWTGPVTVTNGFHMSGDNGGCTLTLSGPINIGTAGISVTNSGNEGPNEGYAVSLTGDTLAGTISGSGGITYYLSGANSRLTVQGTNNYSGGTVVNGDPANPGAKLNVWNGTANTTNYCFSTGLVTLNSNAVIEAAPGSATITNALILNGGTLEAEPQYNNYNQLFWTGPVTLTANSTLLQQETGVLNANMAAGVNVSGPLNMNGFTLTVQNSGPTYSGCTLGGPISGTGSIIYNGQGPDSLYVNGSNTFSGTIEPQLGSLNVGNSNALQFATLDMDPADAGTVTWGVTSVGIGALTGSRNLTLPAGTTSIGFGNATAEFDGVLTGGNLVKGGSGTITLTNANSFTGFITVNGGTLALTGPTAYGGATTVNAGTLSISTPNLVYSSPVTVASGATLNLNFTGTNVISSLVLNGVSEPRGTYGSGTYSGAVISGPGVIQVGATPEIWTGLASSDWSINNDGSPYNWNFNGLATNYTDGSAVQFDDSAVNTTVSIGLQSVMPTAVIFSNTVNSYVVNGFGIAGGAALYKSGNNQVTLNNPNTFLGSMTLSGGMLTVSSSGSLAPNYAGNISFTNGATLEYSSIASDTFSGNLTGPGSLLFDSGTACALTLSGANNYSGTTVISNANNIGIRLAAGAGSLSPKTTFNIVGGPSSGGQLYINSGGIVSNNITFSGLGYNESANPEGSLLLANGVTLSGTITTVSTNLATMPYSQLEVLNQGTTAYAETINGQITGTGGMMFYGLYGGLAGSDSGGTVTITLANTGAPNNYLGITELYNQYTSHAGSGGPNNTKLVLGANEQIPNGPGYGVLALGGWNSANANRSCTFELNGFNETLNGIITPVAGTADNFIQNTTAGASTLTIGDANTNSTYGGTITDGGAGKILNLVKIGTGTLTISGTCTTHGSLTVSNGTVSCTAGVCSATNLYVVSGATLASSVNNYFGNPAPGAWTIAGTITNSATGANDLIMPSSVTLNNGTMSGVTDAAYGTFLSYTVAATITANGSGNVISAGNLGDNTGLIFNTPLATDALTIAGYLGATSAKAGYVIKSGNGTVTLSGASIYTGVTTINGGTLLVTNTAGSATGTGAVNINSGGTLGGTGIITGLVTNNSGGTLLAGLGGSGHLTLSGNVTLAAGSTNTFFVNGSTSANTSVVLGGSVSYAGVLNIVPSGTFTSGQTFTLFSGAGATSPNSFVITGSPGAGLAFNFANGVLSVVSTGPTLTSVTSVTGSSYPVSLGLTGSGFTGASAVLLTNLTTLTGTTITPPALTVNSATSITVSFVPGTATSPWNATVVNGGPSGQVGFTVTAPTVAHVNLGSVKSAGPGNVVLSGTGGVPGNSYAVETATNVPQAVWIPVVTNQFDGSGNFSYTNPVVLGTPRLFLRIQQ